MTPYFTEQYFNPSSIYEAAQPPAQAITAARRAIAGGLGGVDPQEILFTACATESNNTAILGAARGNPAGGTSSRPPWNIRPCYEVCKDLERDGFRGDVPRRRPRRKSRHGRVRPRARPDTLLVTIMHANNETGVIFPVEQLARMTKETDPAIVFHTDATQTVGKLPIDLVREFEHVDLLSFSGHKLHAPKGVGALYVRRGTRCRPSMIGGHQEDGRRAGTENVPYIAGLGQAIKLALDARAGDEARIEQLRDRLERNSSADSLRPGQRQGRPRLPNTLNISCHYIEGEGMLYQLSEHGICASSGSACTSGSLEPSHVLRAMNVPFTAVHGSIRFSLSRYTTDEEIDKVIDVFPQIVANLRKLSPYWDQEHDTPRS